MFFIFSAGFYRPLSRIRPSARGGPVLSHFRYALNAALRVEFDGMDWGCEVRADGSRKPPLCATSDEILRYYSFMRFDVWECTRRNAYLWAFWTALAYVGLLWPRRVANLAAPKPKPPPPLANESPRGLEL